jgi:hypothetical protein
MGTLLRYPYEVRSAEEYFDEIQDVKVTKDMLDLAKHIVDQKSDYGLSVSGDISRVWPRAAWRGGADETYRRAD